MLRWFREEYQIYALRRSMRNTINRFAAVRKAYRLDRRTFDVQKLDWDEQHEVELYSDMIDQIATRRLCRKLQRYDIPFPHPSIDETTAWEYSKQLGVHLLTTEGRHLARTAIREERAARWQDWRIIAPLSGAIGAGLGHFVTLYPQEIAAFLKAIVE